MESRGLFIENMEVNYCSNFSLKIPNLRLFPGKCLQIMGPTGSGKTTLLRAIAGLQRPACGKIVWEGELWCNHQIEVPPFKRGVGFVSQELGLWPHLTVKDHIRIACSGCIDDKELADIIEETGLLNLENRYPKELSGGQKQQLAFARALTKASRLLILDEPFSNTDFVLQDQLIESLLKIWHRKGISVIISSHYWGETDHFNPDILLLEKGRIIYHGPLNEFKKRPPNYFAMRLLNSRVKN